MDASIFQHCRKRARASFCTGWKVHDAWRIQQLLLDSSSTSRAPELVAATVVACFSYVAMTTARD